MAKSGWPMIKGNCNFLSEGRWFTRRLVLSLTITCWTLVTTIFGASEGVMLDTKTKKVINPLVRIGLGNTLDLTDATLVGLAEGGGGGFIDWSSVVNRPASINAIAGITTTNFAIQIL